MMLEEITVACPYCGEAFTALVDASAGDQQYVEDCEVCCRPIQFRTDIDGNGRLIGVDTLRDDD
jgi:hypothetical protein